VPGPTLPVVGVPTTAGTGSEVTPVAVLSDADIELKVGISSPHLIPRAAVCDPTFTYGAPAALTAHAGIDALAHAIESYTARRRPDWEDMAHRVFVGDNAMTRLFAIRAIELLARSLPQAMHDDPGARADAAEGSLYAGLAFAAGGTAAAHALQYPIGAKTKTPHGLGVGVLLPHVVAFNADAVPRRLSHVQDAVRRAGYESDVVTALHAINRTLGIPRTLADLGVEDHDLARMADQAVRITRLIENNPKNVTEADAQSILRAALTGG
jgi:alcohol dehydrogenase class IV